MAEFWAPTGASDYYGIGDNGYVPCDDPGCYAMARPETYDYRCAACGQLFVDVGGALLPYVNLEEWGWLSDEEAKRMGYMTNGRPMPQDEDFKYDYWLVSDADRAGFSELYEQLHMYDAETSDYKIATFWWVSTVDAKRPTSVGGVSSTYVGKCDGPLTTSRSVADEKACRERLPSTYRDIMNESDKPAANGPSWGNVQAAKYAALKLTNPKAAQDYVDRFKMEWVKAYRYVIDAAAKKNGIPAWVLAGIAYQEVGGDAPGQDAAKYGLTHNFNTSFGDISIQGNVAAQALGYDIKKLDGNEKQRIIRSLTDPVQNIFIVAKYLKDLSQQRTDGSWSDRAVFRISAEYNGGANQWKSQEAQDYARRVLDSKQMAYNLL